MTFPVLMLLGIAGCLALGVLLVQARRGQLVSLLSVYVLLFLWECVGGVAKALLPRSLTPYVDVVSMSEVPRVLGLAILGILLFVAGYASLPAALRPREVAAEDAIQEFFAARWTAGYRRALLIALVVTLAAGFVQHAQRISVAGGIEEFLASAYQYRFGTLGESAEQNALIVLANLIGPAAVGLAAITLLAAVRGRLSRAGAALFLALGALLLLRQWTSMFRSVLWFTLVSLAAVYHAAKPITLRAALRTALLLAGTLAAINFGHQYLFYATANWDFQDFSQSLVHLVAPQNQLANLERILDSLQQGAPLLRGQGFLEDLLFFVPRWLWVGKAPAEESGTLLVQAWAGMPTAYQITVGNLGELLAHFGWPGMLGLVAYGWLYRWLDAFGSGSVEQRVALLCTLVPRAPADFGSGLSAMAITVFGLAVFLGITTVIARLGRRQPAVVRAPFAGPPPRPAPADPSRLR